MFKKLLLLFLVAVMSMSAIADDKVSTIKVKYKGFEAIIVIDSYELEGKSSKEQELIKKRYQLEVDLCEKLDIRFSGKGIYDFRATKISPEQLSIRYILLGYDLPAIRAIFNKTDYEANIRFNKFCSNLNKKQDKVMELIRNCYSNCPEMANNLPIIEEKINNIIQNYKPLSKMPTQAYSNNNYMLQTEKVNNSSDVKNENNLIVLTNLSKDELDIHELLLKYNRTYKSIIEMLENGTDAETMKRETGRDFAHFSNNAATELHNVYKFRYRGQVHQEAGKKASSNPRVYFLYDAENNKWVLIHADYKKFVGPEKPKEVQQLLSIISARTKAYTNGIEKPIPQPVVDYDKIRAQEITDIMAELTKIEKGTKEYQALQLLISGSSYYEIQKIFPDIEAIKVFLGKFKNIQFKPTLKMFYDAQNAKNRAQGIRNILDNELPSYIRITTSTPYLQSFIEAISDNVFLEQLLKTDYIVSDPERSNIINNLKNFTGEKIIDFKTAKVTNKDKDDITRLATVVIASYETYKRDGVVENILAVPSAGKGQGYHHNPSNISGFTPPIEGPKGYKRGRVQATPALKAAVADKDFAYLFRMLQLHNELKLLMFDYRIMMYENPYTPTQVANMPKLRPYHAGAISKSEAEFINYFVASHNEYLNGSSLLNPAIVVAIKDKKFLLDLIDALEQHKDKINLEWVESESLEDQSLFWQNQNRGNILNRAQKLSEIIDVRIAFIKDYLVPDVPIISSEVLNTYINKTTLKELLSTLPALHEQYIQGNNLLTALSELDKPQKAETHPVKNRPEQKVIDGFINKYWDYFKNITELDNGFQSINMLEIFKVIYDERIKPIKPQKSQNEIGKIFDINQGIISLMEQDLVKDINNSYQQNTRTGTFTPEILNVSFADYVNTLSRMLFRVELMPQPEFEVTPDIKAEPITTPINEQLSNFIDLAKELEIPTSDRVLDKLKKLDCVTPEVWAQLYDLMINEHRKNNYCALCGTITSLMYSENEIPREIWEITIDILENNEIANDVKKTLVESILSPTNKTIPSKLIANINSILVSNAELIDNWEGTIRKLDKIPTISELLETTEVTTDDKGEIKDQGKSSSENSQVSKMSVKKAKPSESTLKDSLKIVLGSNKTDIAELIEEYTLDIAIRFSENKPLRIEDILLIYGSEENSSTLPLFDYLMQNASNEGNGDLIILFGAITPNSEKSRHVSTSINTGFDLVGLIDLKSGVKVEANTKDAITIKNSATRIESRYMIPAAKIEGALIKK